MSCEAEMLETTASRTKDQGPSTNLSRPADGAAGGACLTEWEPRNSALWYNQPICVGHRLHNLSLFSTDALAELIENYPRKYCMLVHMGPQGTARKLWREG